MQSATYTIICSVVVLATTDQHFHKKLINSSLDVFCTNEASEPVDNQSPSNISYFERVYINGCKPLPFSRLIPSNITEVVLQYLELNAIPSDPPLTEAHFVNLTVRKLNITGQQRLEPSPNFLNLLTTMTEMTVSNMVLPPLPATSRLRRMSLSNGRSGAIGGCSELRVLSIMQWTVKRIPGGWLESCENIATITMQYVDEETIYRVMHGVVYLRRLIIKDSTLVTISADLLIGVRKLFYLAITNSSLHNINEFAFRSQKTFLAYMDLSSNELRGETTARAILGLSGLIWLYLNENPLSDFCEHFNTLDRALQPQCLHLNAASIPRLCFSSWSNLWLLELKMNNITEMTLTELPTAPEGYRRGPNNMLEVDLKQNPLRAPPDNKAFFIKLTEKFKMTFVKVYVELTLDCNCQHGWLAKALGFLPIIIKGLTCTNNNSLDDEPSERLECDRNFECEPCTCRRYWSNSTTVADCRNRSLHSVPRIPGADELLAADNLIAAIHVEDFPVSLGLVDLTNNRLRRADAAAAHALLADGSGRRVRLAGNPLACDCDNVPLINALQNHNMTVEDFSRLKCASSGTELALVSVFEMCKAPRMWVMTAVAVVGAMAALVATATALYFRYNRVVRVFLHARGLLCCGDYDEDETDFLYDAFISFSHQDTNFAEELIEVLESESNGWHTCVHYRDWIAGELIPMQITRAVAQSRRTIVLLSRNFLESQWGMLEFRTAHANALHHKRARLVLVVLDDVLDEQLDAEVRGYVRTNTYVRWDDPWFWDKLLYVMPPRRANSRGPSESITLTAIGISPAVEQG